MNSLAARFDVARYRFVLRPIDIIRAPARNKGNMLRGAFGCAFKAMACSAPAGRGVPDPCRMRCQSPESCPYGVVFETSPPPGALRLRLNQDVPRPFVIKPPLELKTEYRPADRLVFEIVLIGRSVDYLPYFILAFRQMADTGIGLRDDRGRRGRAALQSVDAVMPDGGLQPVYADTDNLVRNGGRAIPARDLTAPSAQDCGLDARVRVEFLTDNDNPMACDRRNTDEHSAQP